jgi:hypothetical protein
MAFALHFKCINHLPASPESSAITEGIERNATSIIEPENATSTSFCA